MVSARSLAMATALALGAPGSQDAPREPAGDTGVLAAFDSADGWFAEGKYVRSLVLRGETWSVRGEAWWTRDGSSVRVEGRAVGPGRRSFDTGAELSGGEWLVVDRTGRAWTRASRLPATPPSEAVAPAALGALAASLAPPVFAPEAPDDCADTGETAAVGGATCRVSTCERAGVAERWYLDARSGLPRLVERTTALDAGERLVERLTLTELRPLAAGERAPSLAIPEGFARQAAAEPGVVAEAEAAPRPAAQADGTDALASLADSLDPLLEAFESGRGRPRVVGVFAPS